jgi:hypothetical protein
MLQFALKRDPAVWLTCKGARFADQLLSKSRSSSSTRWSPTTHASPVPRPRCRPLGHRHTSLSDAPFEPSAQVKSAPGSSSRCGSRRVDPTALHVGRRGCHRMSTSSGRDEEVILVDPGTVILVGLGPLAVGEGRARAGGPRRWRRPTPCGDSAARPGWPTGSPGVGRNQGHRGTGVGSAGLYQ